jgi:hypothetical protein
MRGNRPPRRRRSGNAPPQQGRGPSGPLPFSHGGGERWRSPATAASGRSVPGSPSGAGAASRGQREGGPRTVVSAGSLVRSASSHGTPGHPRGPVREEPPSGQASTSQAPPEPTEGDRPGGARWAIEIAPSIRFHLSKDNDTRHSTAVPRETFFAPPIGTNLAPLVSVNKAALGGDGDPTASRFDLLRAESRVPSAATQLRAKRVPASGASKGDTPWASWIST